MNPSIRKVESAHAPKAIGPYSQAVIAGNFVFVSGQIPLDPMNGNIVQGGIKEQTERVLLNIEAVLQSAGLSIEHIVKMEVFMTNIGLFQEMNEAYQEKINGDVKPARYVVEVSRLPKDVMIEIACVAYQEP
ncbi:MAG: Rid family detoxifying hydrolase [Chlamydiota bacterium]|nr:Rid family detoxifying hydrolase [Chlamydiota bacterium]